MKKYGKFVIFPVDISDRFAVVIESDNYLLDLEAGGLNFYGKIVKVVHTADKAFRLIRKYEQKMGRTS